MKNKGYLEITFEKVCYLIMSRIVLFCFTYNGQNHTQNVLI